MDVDLAKLDQDKLNEELEAPEQEVEQTQDSIESSTVQEESSEQVKSEEQPVDEIAELREEIAKLQKMNEDARTYIGQQSTELGQLRKQAQELNNPDVKPEDAMNEFVQGPKEFTKKAVLEELEKREQLKVQNMQQVQQNRQWVESQIPEFQELTTDLIEAAQKQGIQGANMEMLNHELRVNPWGVLQFARSVKLEKELNALKNQTQASIDKTQTVVEKAGAKSKKTSVTAGSGLSGNEKPDASQLSSMSLAELDQLLKEPD